MSVTNGTDDAAAGLAVGIGLVFIIIFSVIGLILYILPGIIASMRRHPQALAIWLVTIFLGATGIGWIAAFIWAFVTPQPATMAVTMAMPPQPLPPQPYPPVATPAAPSASTAMTDEIAALARLRDQGVLTEAEFTARKHLLLGEAPPAATPAPVATPAPPPVAPPVAVAEQAPPAPPGPPTEAV